MDREQKIELLRLLEEKARRSTVYRHRTVIQSAVMAEQGTAPTCYLCAGIFTFAVTVRMGV